jgi:hypothetical protein
VGRALRIPIALAILTGIALVTVALAAGSAGSANPPLCSYGGIRYVGMTSQHQRLCFTLTAKGTVMREYGFDYVDTCGTGTNRSQNARAGVAPVTKTGVFNRLAPGGFFKGVIKGRKASGTFRLNSETTIIGKGTVSCDTHVVRWTARRVS